MLKRYMEFMGNKAEDLTLESLREDLDWTWPLFLAAFVFGLAVLRGGL